MGRPTPQSAPGPIVHQDLGLVPNLNAIENLALGRGYHGITVDSLEHEALQAQELLRGLGILPDVRKPVGCLVLSKPMWQLGVLQLG